MTEGMGVLESSVKDALGEVDDRDQGAAALALTYARQIDAGGDATKLGPVLLSTLDALLLTPRSRAAAVKGGSGADKPTPGRRLDEIAERRARKGRAADLDAATP